VLRSLISVRRMTRRLIGKWWWWASNHDCWDARGGEGGEGEEESGIAGWEELGAFDLRKRGEQEMRRCVSVVKPRHSWAGGDIACTSDKFLWHVKILSSSENIFWDIRNNYIYILTLSWNISKYIQIICNSIPWFIIIMLFLLLLSFRQILGNGMSYHSLSFPSGIY